MSVRAGWLALAVALGGGCAGGPQREVRLRSATTNASGSASASAHAAVGSTSASAVAKGAPGASCVACNRYGSPTQAGVLAEKAHDEISGIAESAGHRGVFWVHNDSGDSARFFGIESSGRQRAEVKLDGVKAIDFEDIAVGPCGKQVCVFVGDIGDNHQKRTEVAIHRVVESDITLDARAPQTLTPITTRASYPDGPHDAESLFLDPGSGDAYVISKVWLGPGTVYRLAAAQLDAPGTQTFERIAMLPGIGGVDPITAAGAHPCAPRVIVRTYRHVFEFEGAPGEPFARIFSHVPRMLRAPREEQGESIGYFRDGRGFITTSEGDKQPIWVSGCED